jgi:hypothetical protein
MAFAARAAGQGASLLSSRPCAPIAEIVLRHGPVERHALARPSSSDRPESSDADLRVTAFHWREDRGDSIWIPQGAFKTPPNLADVLKKEGGQVLGIPLPSAAVASPPKGSYEARVMQGIWAAAPYLHNGSVPTLA